MWKSKISPKPDGIRISQGCTFHAVTSSQKALGFTSPNNNSNNSSNNSIDNCNISNNSNLSIRDKRKFEDSYPKDIPMQPPIVVNTDGNSKNGNHFSKKRKIEAVSIVGKKGKGKNNGSVMKVASIKSFFC